MTTEAALPLLYKAIMWLAGVVSALLSLLYAGLRMENKENRRLIKEQDERMTRHEIDSAAKLAKQSADIAELHRGFGRIEQAQKDHSNQMEKKIDNLSHEILEIIKKNA